MDKTDLDIRFRTLQVIWVALMMGVGMFSVVVFVLLNVLGQSFGTLEPGILQMAAPALVVVMFAGLLVGRRLEAAIPRDSPPPDRLQRYQTARIIALALCEGPGLLIIVLSMLTDQATWALGGGAAALWAMVLARPRREDFEQLARD